MAQLGNVVRSASFSTSISGTALVSAVLKKRIRVLGIAFSCAGTVNTKLQSAATDLTGLFYGVANTQVCLPVVADHENGFWCETKSGEALNINLSAAVVVGGVLVFKIV